MDMEMETLVDSISPEYKEIENFVNIVICHDTLNECFSGFTKPMPRNDLQTKKVLRNELITIFKSMDGSTDQIKNALKLYISLSSLAVNFNQSNVLFGFLENLIQAEVVKPMIVCQLVLSEHFVLKNELFWVNGLKFIYRIIHTVKYKEVRDILGLLLTKIPMIPIKSTDSVYKQVDVFYSVIATILDRNASLLPAYLVLDEIQNKFYTKIFQNGHWIFSRLFSRFVDSFLSIAKIVSHSGRPRIMPIVGYSFLINSLKLDEKTAKYKLKGLLPYDKELNEPPLMLLLNILEQNNSRETIANVLSLSKSKEFTDYQIHIIEKLLIKLIISTIVKSCNYKSFFENDDFENLNFNDIDSDVGQIAFLWNHISSTSIYFAFLYQNIYFPRFLIELYETICSSLSISIANSQLINIDKKQLQKCREFLMWTLLQILSFFPNNIIDLTYQNEYFFKLFELLYPENEPLPLPDFTKRNSVYIMSPASIYIFLIKNDTENSIKIQHTIPIALKIHIDYLRSNQINPNDYSIAILCNSYSSNAENYTNLYRYFIENIMESRMNSNSTVQAAVKAPIPMELLDSLPIHTRTKLTNWILSRFMTIVQNKTLPSFPPYLMETYCRLTSFSEIELNETKSLNILMVSILQSHGWNYLFNFLELYSHRLHRINCANQIQLLRQIFSKNCIGQINHIQLYSFMENTALKIFYGFNCFEFIAFCAFQPKIIAENFLPPDSEELYKIFVYTLARALHITGTETMSSDKLHTWVNEILKEIKNLNINLAWPSFTLQCFPAIISEFYQSNAKKEPNHSQLKKSVDEEYRRWKSITNENDLIKHFTSQGTPPLIYCLLYKMLLDSEPIPQVSYKILDKIGVRALSNHLRTFADFLVLEFANLMGGNHVNKSRDAVNDLIWKCNIVTLDKLLLCLALRSFEGNEAKVCFFIIQLLVLKNIDIKNRINDFVKENSPEHWRQSNWWEIQNNFHKKYPEKYYFDYLQDGNNQVNQNNIPSIFSNICLRILPVFDIIIHRLIELPTCANVSNFALKILDEHGCLYKFHSHPITFLYNTLHYYETNLRDKAMHKKKLVFTIINAFKDIKPKNWAVTEPFLSYCLRNDEDWCPGAEYYKFLIGRFVNTLSSSNKCPFSMTDYRFNEFPNVQSHALFVTCVEILALPGCRLDVANHLINVVVNNHTNIIRQDIELWINAIGLIFTALPESYSSILKERMIQLLKSVKSFSNKNLSHLFDFKNSHAHFYENDISYVLALLHSYWNHGTIGQLCQMSQFIKEKVKPIVETEEQLMVVCYFVGPFLQRLTSERTRCVIDIAHELYQMLDIVDKKCTNLYHIDTICDLFYHLKYRFTGNNLKKFIDERIQTLRPELQKKLRFLPQVSNDAS